MSIPRSFDAFASALAEAVLRDVRTYVTEDMPVSEQYAEDTVESVERIAEVRMRRIGAKFYEWCKKEGYV